MKECLWWVRKGRKENAVPGALILFFALLKQAGWRVSHNISELNDYGVRKDSKSLSSNPNELGYG